MRLTMLLADYAQAINGKLYIMGGGWSVALLNGPLSSPSAIVIKIDVPWDEANRQHTIRLQLIDADGHAVVVATPDGERPVEVESKFEVGRPAGVPPGTSIDCSMVINIPPLPLAPRRRYVWRCSLDGNFDTLWDLAFSTQPALLPPAAAG